MQPETKICTYCNQSLTFDKFYKNKTTNKCFGYCKNCESCRKRYQLNNFKLQCLDYKQTNCCSICGFDKYIESLDFHHLDPTQKDFTISNYKIVHLNQKFKDELDKCIVVCSNCHRHLHKMEEMKWEPNIKLEKRCQDCNILIKNLNKGVMKCRMCYSQKSKRPTKEQLILDFNNLNTLVAVSKKYGVVSHTIKYWALKYDIDYKSYKNKTIET